MIEAPICALYHDIAFLELMEDFWWQNRHISQVYSTPSGVINMVVPE